MYVKNDTVERRTQEERRAATRLALVCAARELFAGGGYHVTARDEVRGGLKRLLEGLLGRKAG